MSETVVNYELEWDKGGEHWFEAGVDHCVLYVMNESATGYEDGVAWNGITSVSESPDGADKTDFWADGIKYASLRAAESFGGSIEAYTYPDEFGVCDGSAEIATGITIGLQTRRAFGLCYRTKVSNEQAADYYKIHLVYNATVSPSEKSYETINDSPDAISFSWDFDTTPVNVTGHKPTATVIIDTRYVDAAKLAKLTKKLYGGAGQKPTLLTPNEILAEIA